MAGSHLRVAPVAVPFLNFRYRFRSSSMRANKALVVAKRTVLVVDDDPTIRSTLTEALREWGYEPRQAATLGEALTLVDRERPAAVLLDVKLPDGSGIGILDELKKRSPETVIIIITGYVNPKSAFEAGLRQAYGFLTKPLDQTEVRSMLEEALAGGRVAKSRREDVERVPGPTPG